MSRPRAFSYEEACEMYKSGFSPEQCADFFGVHGVTMRRALKVSGVSLRRRKLGPLSKEQVKTRMAIVRDVASRGLFLSHAVRDVSLAEGTPITFKKLMNWVRYHSEDNLLATLKSNRENWVAARKATIILKQSPRETAIANMGKASAAQIADAVGTTRNAVIGFWFRHRNRANIAGEA